MLEWGDTLVKQNNTKTVYKFRSRIPFENAIQDSLA